MVSKLEQLKQLTEIVADTGNIEAIKLHKPTDATTNPALVLQAAQLPVYQQDLKKLLKEQASASLEALQDRVAVYVGAEILSLVPGYVSTEVDAHLSFDTKAMVTKALQIIELYHQQQIDTQRILIKLAATWEGIKAAEILEKQGIKCNLTLLFSFAQARACADSGVFLISPFVGRIMDWYVAKEGRAFTKGEDPGVLSVKKIFNFYKKYRYQTVIMGASFRNQGQIEALAGCDKLTISPELLAALSQDENVLEVGLKTPSESDATTFEPMSKTCFAWEHNEDAMAVEKLSEGIRKFAQAQRALASLIKDQCNT